MMKKVFVYFLTLLVLLMMISSKQLVSAQSQVFEEEVLIIGNKRINYHDNRAVMIPKHPVYKKMEFRGVWVATVWNIDMPQQVTKEEYQQTFLSF